MELQTTVTGPILVGHKSYTRGAQVLYLSSTSPIPVNGMSQSYIKAFMNLPMNKRMKETKYVAFSTQKGGGRQNDAHGTRGKLPALCKRV